MGRAGCLGTGVLAEGPFQPVVDARVRNDANRLIFSVHLVHGRYPVLARVSRCCIFVFVGSLVVAHPNNWTTGGDVLEMGLNPRSSVWSNSDRRRSAEFSGRFLNRLVKVPGTRLPTGAPLTHRLFALGKR